ncbi:MAG: hypothetical protein ACOZNI_23530 [Myxococcota bacterium]
MTPYADETATESVWMVAFEVDGTDELVFFEVDAREDDDDASRPDQGHAPS